MRRALVVATALALLLTQAGCAASVTPTLSPSAPTISSFPNLVVHLESEAQVKRAEWNAYQPITFGMELRRGDLIKTGPEGRVRIVCHDISLKTIGHGYEGPVPCPWPRSSLPTPSLAPLRAGELIGIPYVISPRKTKLMVPNPLLKWNPVPAAAKYEVVVRGAGMEWRIESTSSEMFYPPEAPSLVPGEDYKLEVIEQGGGRSSEEEKLPPGFGFSVMLPREVQGVITLEERIRNMGLERVPTHFILAYLYALKELRTASIAELQALTAEAANPAIYRFLGDLYLEMWLYSYAIDAYSQAAALSQQLEDTEGEAEAQAGLGSAYFGLGNTVEAVRRLRKAAALYDTLGDRRKTDVLELIDAIEK